MTRPTMALWLLLAGCAGCAPAYVYGRTAAAAPAKPPGCRFELLEEVPKRPYEELGVLAPPDIEYGDMVVGPVPFREAVGDAVCAAGGDAVVAERGAFDRYVRATVIRYR